MRWKQSGHGETRVVEKFLFVPMTFNNETQWWENARIVQRYVEILRERDIMLAQWLGEYRLGTTPMEKTFLGNYSTHPSVPDRAKSAERRATAPTALVS